MPIILYVCECCYDHSPDVAGHRDHKELRVMPNGQWLCEDCYWNMDTPDLTGTYGVEPAAYDADGDVDEWPRWSGFSIPPEYVPSTGEDQ